MWSIVLYNQFNRCNDETRAKYDQVISSYEDLELSVDEKIWQEQYEAKKHEVQDEYMRFFQAVSGMDVAFEAAGIEQRQKEAETIAAAGAPGPAVAPARGGAAAAGWRVERVLQPEKLPADCNRQEYRAFLCSWNAYYVPSRFASARVVMQIAYLTNCLAPDLLAKLQFGGCGTTADALIVIDLDYKQRNPLTV